MSASERAAKRGVRLYVQVVRTKKVQQFAHGMRVFPSTAELRRALVRSDVVTLDRNRIYNVLRLRRHAVRARWQPKRTYAS